MTSTDVVIEKVMSIAPHEFARSLAALLPGIAFACDAQSSTEVDAPLAGGHVGIAFVPLPPRTLGGLVSLPQARVTLTFSHVSPAARAAFLNRFDIAFQRGGG